MHQLHINCTAYQLHFNEQWVNSVNYLIMHGKNDGNLQWLWLTIAIITSSLLYEGLESINDKNIFYD